MIDVKKATESAYAYFESLFKSQFEDLALEEVELTNDEKYWLITLGYDVKIKTQFASFIPDSFERKYKIFKVDSETGKVWSMKIRKI